MTAEDEVGTDAGGNGRAAGDRPLGATGDRADRARSQELQQARQKALQQPQQLARQRDGQRDGQRDRQPAEQAEPHGVDPDVEAVHEDLMRLRKGRGLQSPDLARRVGPALVAALGLDLTLPGSELQRQVQSGVVEAAQRLTGDLREAVLVALAVEGWTTDALLTDRIDAVAARMDRDARTARRRLDAATRRLADAIVGRRAVEAVANPYAPSGWYVESLASTYRLDVPTARLTEDRVIVAETDGLDTVTATLTVPPRVAGEVPTLDVVAEAGCRIRGAYHVSDSHWRYELALPHALRAGERHRYVVSFTVPDRDRLRPFYTLIPLRRTRHFSAELRFAGPEAVAQIWRLDGVPQAVLDDGRPTNRLLQLDEAGVVRVRFEQCLQGLCYGVQWRWA